LRGREIMGNKHKSVSKWSRLRQHWVVVFLGVFMAVLWGAVAYQATHAKSRPKASTASQPVPVYFNRAEDAMPFPSTVDPTKFKSASVREAYQVAREIPGLLAQQPCYCYCQRIGHRGLLDCFRTEHAATCNVCTKEALLASRMHREGKSAEEIRAAIIHVSGDTLTVSSVAAAKKKSKS
jgi:hypothetical protein